MISFSVQHYSFTIIQNCFQLIHLCDLLYLSKYLKPN